MIEVGGIAPQITSAIVAGVFMLANSLLTILVMRAMRGQEHEKDRTIEKAMDALEGDLHKPDPPVKGVE